MPYYPKSQIKTDLYTNGDEYMVSSTQEPYVGYYYEISSNAKYTGKNPNDKPNQILSTINLVEPELFPNTYIIPQPVITNNSISYPQTTFNSSIYLPQFNSPLPTSDDYKKGIFTRYFCKKNNEDKYLEVDQTTYNKLTLKDSSILWSLYTPFSIQWKISINAEQNVTFNSNQITQLENKGDYIGFSSYIRSYSQYTLTQEEFDQQLNPNSPTNEGGY